MDKQVGRQTERQTGRHTHTERDRDHVFESVAAREIQNPDFEHVTVIDLPEIVRVVLKVGRRKWEIRKETSYNRAHLVLRGKEVQGNGNGELGNEE